ncbi:hypothetical protein BH09BAC3_BH09BAC3_01390 [soil metagenome]
MKTSILLFVLMVIMWSCQIEQKAEQSNSPKDGVDISNSDPAAIELADSIMIAVGGRENWNSTRFFSWTLSGERKIFWDKEMGRGRIENERDGSVYLVNLNNGSGRVEVNGNELIEPDSLRRRLKIARSILIEDVYGLVLPFKLKDSGVTLKYMGEDTLKGRFYNILQLTFPKIDKDPQKEYKIYVDVKEKIVKYWSYYADSRQEMPTFTRPWDNYQKYGRILISSNRSYGDGPTSVKVEESLPEKLFTEF